MPTYEYACTVCADRFEVVQSFVDAALTECRACGGRLRKVFSPVGVVFKGSGFYRTDSRKPATSTGSGTDSKPDSKPADPPAKPSASTPSGGSPSPAAAAAG